jgi:hypothetical protein
VYGIHFSVEQRFPFDRPEFPANKSQFQQTNETEHDMPDEVEPTPEEKRRLLATIPGDTGTALRLVAAFADADIADAKAAIDEIAASERSLFVLAALATLASRLAYGLVEKGGETYHTWLNAAVVGMVDEVHQRLGDEGGVK